MTYDQSNKLWHKLLDMDYDDLVDKLIEDKELIIEKHPDLKERIEQL